MSIMQEFKEFAVKGNMIDMAVGIVVGGAFTKIVSSLVADVIMPPLGVLIAGVDFKALAITLKPAVLDAAGAVTTPAVVLAYGRFVQNFFDFLVIAFTIFMVVKGINTLRSRMEKLKPAPKA